MRLFIAVALPEPVKHAIEKAQAELVDPKRLDALLDAAGRACHGFGVLQFRAGRIGAFPDLRRPRVIFARVHGEADRLPALQRAVATAAAAFTAEKPDGVFTGHVTLGRGHTITRPQVEMLGKLADSMEHRSFGRWVADRIDIIRSELTPAGSQHTRVAAVPLTPH